MKYRVSGAATVSCWTDVEASSPEEAVALASERPLASLCAYPFSGMVDEEFHFEGDGEPLDLTAEPQQ